jgi:phosphatidylinositol glycan class M
MNITTRGSPEAVIVLLVIATLACLRAAEAAQQQHADVHAVSRVERLRNDDGRTTKWETCAAVLLALAVSYKIYPAIYVPPIWSVLARRHRWLGLAVWRFGLVAATTLLVVNGILWSM